MQSHNKITGYLGESIACKFLLKHNYKILERNWTCYAGELDIVSLAPTNYLVFVEVKFVKSNYCKPYELLTKSKLHHLRRSINQYLLKNERYLDNWRLDLIAIDKKLTHYTNILSN